MISLKRKRRRHDLSRLLFLAALPLLTVAIRGEAQVAEQDLFAPLAETAVQPLRTEAVRRRLVTIDRGQLDRARRASSVPVGRDAAPPRGAILRLNLFDDTVVTAVVESTAPTLSGGYSLSARIAGEPVGDLVLVVNGDTVAGSVVTRAGTYSLESADGGVAVSEVQAQPFHCQAPAAAPPSNERRVGDRNSSRLSEAHAQSDEDVTTVDTAVFYTPASGRKLGGKEGAQAAAELRIAEANRSLSESGALVRLRLVAAEEVAYEEVGSTLEEINRFRGTTDGYMDEVHAVRRQVAADLMVLFSQRGGARAFVTPGAANAFLLGGPGTSRGIFLHETGHTLGSLAHDRYSSCGNQCTGSGFGYVNARAFEAGAPPSARWRTIMAYFDRCRDAGFQCDELYRFSNPNQVHPDPGGDPMGVPADDPSTGWDGPADATRAINSRREAVAKYYAAPDIELSFGSATYTATEGGQAATVTVSLSAAPTRPISVPLAVSGASVREYEIPSAVEFGSNDTEKTFTVTAVDDVIDESNEQLTVALGESLLRGVTAQGSTTITLVDNDSATSAPTVVSVEITSSPGTSGFYRANDVIEAMVRFSQYVSVAGSPTLALTLGGARRWAAYRRTAGEAVWFSYAVGEGDLARDGVSIGSDRLELNGGSIQDEAARSAGLGHAPVAADRGHAVDAAGPTVSEASVHYELLVLEFDEELVFPERSYWNPFHLAVDGRTVSTEVVQAGGSSVQMSVSSPIVAGQGVTLAYRPGNRPIRDQAGNSAALFSLAAEEIENHTPAAVYDADRDGLIEVADVAQLDAIRYDSNGDGQPLQEPAYHSAFPDIGLRHYCAGGCSGYELVADLDLDSNGNGAADAGDEYWNNGSGWVPIGEVQTPFSGTFNGGGHTVSNLFISRPTESAVGLFGSAAGSIEAVGLVEVDVHGDADVGGLVGATSGQVRDSFATGQVAGSHAVGGLVGRGGVVERSYAAVKVEGESAVGGLVGEGSFFARILSSYASGTVIITGGGSTAGSLHGTNSGVSRFSYATGQVIGTAGGGLTGASYYGVRDSYWDLTTAGQEGSDEPGGRTTADLQAPTGNVGVYVAWSGDVWDFGSAAQYPALKADFDGDGRATWGEFGYQLRSGPRLRAAAEADGVTLTWSAVNASPWRVAPTVSYTVYRRVGAAVEMLAQNIAGRRYVDSGVNGDDDVRYQVVAVVAGGDAGRSAWMAPGEAPPPPPSSGGGGGGGGSGAWRWPGAWRRRRGRRR